MVFWGIFSTLRFGRNHGTASSYAMSAVEPVKLLAAAIQQYRDFIARFAKSVIGACEEERSFWLHFGHPEARNKASKVDQQYRARRCLSPKSAK